MPTAQPVRVAINGFGRIGRLALRIGRTSKKLQFVAINDLADPAMNAYLFKHDSSYGTYPEDVAVKSGALVVGKRQIKMFSEKDPTKLPWKRLKVDVVIESTGHFTERDKAMLHVQGGAKRVVISAPGNGEDATINIGVNDDVCSPEHVIFSNASCTTNSLSPVAKVLDDTFGIVAGLMDTVHSYTNDQSLLDVVHPKDMRRARAAAINIIPTTSGATKATAKVVTTLKDRMDGMALRVPTPVGSITNFVCQLKKAATPKQINNALKKAAGGDMKDVLEYTEEPIVSRDIVGNPHSSIVDGSLTQAVGKLARVCAWYDNEFGYTHQLIRLVEKVGRLG